MAACIPLAVFVPGALRDVAWSDDFFVLLSEQSNIDSIINLVVGDGRPLYALLLVISSESVSQTSHLLPLRLLGTAGLAIAAILCLRVLHIEQRRYRYGLSVLVALGFCLPTFQFYAHWSVAWPYSWAISLSVAGYLVIMRSNSIGAWSVAALLISLSFSIYQAAGPFFLATVGVLAVVAQPQVACLRRMFLRALLLLAAGLATYVIAAMLAIALLGRTLNSKVTPVGLSDIPGNVAWYFSRHVALAFQPFLVDRPSAATFLLVAVPLALLVAFTVGLQATRLHESVFERVLYVGLLVLASSSPLLLSARQVEHRFIPGLAWGVFCLAGCSLWYQIQLQHSRVVLRVTLALLILGGPLLAFWVAESNLHRLVTRPADVRDEWIASSLRDCPAKFPSVTVLPALGQWPKWNKVGSFSEVSDLAQPWVVQNSVRHALLNWRGSSQAVKVEVSRSQSSQRCLLDLEVLRLNLTAKMNKRA